MVYPYKYVVCGGTFDFLHRGHKAFLDFVFSQGERVVIGLTTDFYIASHKGNAGVSSFALREEQLQTFLKEQGYSQRAEIYPIDDLYGPTLSPDIPLEAIIITEDTRTGAEQINATRKQRKLPELAIISAPMIQENGKTISSSQIREEGVGIEENVFFNALWKTEQLHLPLSLRKTLQKPFGTFITMDEVKLLDATKVITVGDVTTQNCNKEHIGQFLSVIDFRVEREKTGQTLREIGFTGEEKAYALTNPPGSITPAVWELMATIMSQDKRSVLVIDGEEDLLVLPLVILLPVGFRILYGQPHEGMLCITVTIPLKQEMRHLLDQFESTTRGY